MMMKPGLVLYSRIINKTVVRGVKRSDVRTCFGFDVNNFGFNICRIVGRGWFFTLRCLRSAIFVVPGLAAVRLGSLNWRRMSLP